MSVKARIVGDETVPAQNDAMLRYGAATLAFASQLIHLWILQEEFLFRPLSGGLIFLAAVCQGFLAAGLLFGSGKWMVRFGMALNFSLALVWISTRFVGYPGLLGFSRLPVEPLNLAAFAAEVAIVFLLVGVARNSTSGRDAEPRPQPAQKD